MVRLQQSVTPNSFASTYGVLSIDPQPNASHRVDGIDLDVAVQTLDRLAEADLATRLRRCCGATRWVDGMVQGRPHRSRAALLQAAETAADGLEREDWLEAFSHHPRIGDLDNLRRRFADTAEWSQGEQASVATANEQVLADLAEGNRLYESRFGYIFIVCASGRSAEEMLQLLRQRLPNAPDDEWKVAAEQQRRITALRLDRLLRDGVP